MKSKYDELHVPVLIVGAGPAGLMTSLLLARHGVRSLVIERHPGTSILPRATGINVRTMEIFRALGLEDGIRAAEVDVRGLPVLTEMDTLSGPVLKAVPNLNSRGDDPNWPSPTRQSFLSQEVLEPLLVEALRQTTHSDLRFNTELVCFEQDAKHVSAELCDRASDTTQVLTADYLVAADGAHSRIREALGIGMAGHGQMNSMINVLFEAELSRPLAGRRSIVFRLRNRWLPDGAIFRNNDGRNRWTLIAPDVGEASPSRVIEIIRNCAGDPQLPVEILATGTWTKAALLADRFRDGRVFLVGDAAHRVAPAGAMGMNTAIQSAHNLAWKLAGVVSGWAGAGLLDSYEEERRPLAGRTVELSYENERTGEHARPILGMMLGAAYNDGAFVVDGTTEPRVSDPITDYVPSARPGRRAPHCWLSSDGARLSTIDLFDGRFILLSPSSRWCEPAVAAGHVSGIPIEALVIRDTAWASMYDVGDNGAVLVRPDGYVAWRSHDAPDGARNGLADALEIVVSRAAQPAGDR
jgi:putative polyketide hydroxylase